MDQLQPAHPSRRDALKRAGLVAGAAGVAWAAPSISTLGSAAFAAGSAPMGTPGSTFSLSTLFNGSDQPTPFQLRQITGPLTITANLFQDSQLPSLQGGNNGNKDATFPVAAKNTGGAFTTGSITVPAGVVFVHPDNNDANPLIVRFQPSAGGTFTLSGVLSDADSAGGSVTYAFVPGPGATGTGVTPPGVLNSGSVPFTGSFTITPGGYVDFLLGPNGSYGNDSHTLELVFTS